MPHCDEWHLEVMGVSFAITLSHGMPTEGAGPRWFWLAGALRSRDPEALKILAEVHAELTGGVLPGPSRHRWAGRELDVFLDRMERDLEHAAACGWLAIREEQSLSGVWTGERPPREEPPSPPPPVSERVPTPAARPWNLDVAPSLLAAAAAGAPFWQPCEKCGRALEEGLGG